VMKYLSMPEFAKATDTITIVPFFFRKLTQVTQLRSQISLFDDLKAYFR